MGFFNLKSAAHAGYIKIRPKCRPIGFSSRKFLERFSSPEAHGAFNGRPDPSNRHPIRWLGPGLKARLFEGQLNQSNWSFWE